ncbi:hypothetical protein CUZ56_01337 [Saezia sanguinis]|uniref:Uncharacterized protein n=1 Tax=Saezia sanguinis TaxID=1965230 RepID=A0A433SF93_9BURK|nr:hypothetical protein [Saezia sanguinis]RUS67392.1 hypothetical protein CUZ56_01337 [Saezia sanguinis]
MGKGTPSDSKTQSADNKAGTGQTTPGTNSTKPENVISQCISEKLPYFVMMAYHDPDKPGKSEAFRVAAEFKKKRLKQIYPKAIIDVEDKVTHTADFISILNGIGEKIKNCPNYLLKEVHFFGHSNFDMLFFHGKGDNLTYGKLKELNPLPWDNDYLDAALVLHSCRSSRFEDQEEDKDIRAEKCIANALSKHLNAKVVGQVTFATNNTGKTVNDWKYRNSALKNQWEIDWFTMNPNIVLWAYAAGTSVQATHGNSEEYKKFLTYQTHYIRGVRYTTSESNNQIWPCRAFQPGRTFERVVEKDKFNRFDLIYI